VKLSLVVKILHRGNLFKIEVKINKAEIEINEIISIFVVSIKTAQNNQK